MLICFHGTSKHKAYKILREGFKPGTYFAKHLEDAIGFGGGHVFSVRFEDSGFAGWGEWWQFHAESHIAPDRIWKLTRYSPVKVMGTDEPPRSPAH